VLLSIRGSVRRAAFWLPLIWAVCLIFSSSLLVAQMGNDESAADSDVSALTQPQAADSSITGSDGQASPQEESSSATSPSDSSSKQNLVPSSTPQPTFTPVSNGVQWKPAIIQTLSVTVFQHAWRAATDPSLRYLVAHKPFWHDYGVSLTDYHMDHWSDGDSFVVNDVGHPLEGAVFGRALLQNYPRSFVQIGLHNGYWTTRLQSLAWMTLWSTQFEIGPLSETAFGNQGGFYYSNGCGTSPTCLTTPPWSYGAHNHTGLGGVTNNTGWTDFIITPLVGLGWILGEDTIDRFIVTPIARNHRILGGRVLRSALEPSRSFAAFFAGKFPWMLPAPESNFVDHHPRVIKPKDPNEKPVQHYAIGTQYTNISLPVIKAGCETACRQPLSGAGFTFDYNFTHYFAFDSALNFLPAQSGTKGMMQGLFGVKLGESWKHWGLFAKVRPGFIYYNEAWPGGGVDAPGSLTRFAWDVGGVAEFYTQHGGTFRVDLGTTLVRYLTDRVDTRFTQIGGVISNQYYVTQGNVQFSTTYAFRF